MDLRFEFFVIVLDLYCYFSFFLQARIVLQPKLMFMGDGIVATGSPRSVHKHRARVRKRFAPGGHAEQTIAASLPPLARVAAASKTAASPPLAVPSRARKMPSASLLAATSAGAQLGHSLAPTLRRRRCCRVTAASTSLPTDGLGLGRRAVSLAGVAAWLATTSGRKFNCTSYVCPFWASSLLRVLQGQSNQFFSATVVAGAEASPFDNYVKRYC